MDPETLSLQLAALHADLKNARELDPQSRQLLAEVLADIQRLMAVQGGAEERDFRGAACQVLWFVGLGRLIAAGLADFAQDQQDCDADYDDQ